MPSDPPSETASASLRLALFDFDDTVLAGDSILYFLRFYYAQRPGRRFFQVFSWMGLLLKGIGILSSSNLKRIFLLPLSYENPAERERLARDFVHREIPRHFYRELLWRLSLHRKAGHAVVIISASVTFYLRYLEDLFPAARILGTAMEFPDKGPWRLPRYETVNCKGAHKLDKLDRALGPRWRERADFGYSDHVSDSPLLEACARAFVIEPGKRMRERAKEKGWALMPVRALHPAGSLPVLLEKLRLLFLCAGPVSAKLSPEMQRQVAADFRKGYFESEPADPEFEQARLLFQEINPGSH